MSRPSNAARGDEGGCGRASWGMIRNRSLCAAGLAALVLLLFPLFDIGTLEAAFFMRMGGASASRQLAAMGGRTVYTTTARVNGVAVELHVLGFETAPREIGEKVRLLWQLPPLRGDGPAWLTRRTAGGYPTSHLLILPGTRWSEATAWLIEPRDGAPSVPTPGTGAIIPAPPGPNPCPDAELSFWAVNDRTRSLYVLYRTPANAATALEMATTTLAADGWQSQVHTGNFALLARDGRAALACATRDESDGWTKLSVMMQGVARQ